MVTWCSGSDVLDYGDWCVVRVMYGCMVIGLSDIGVLLFTSMCDGCSDTRGLYIVSSFID